MRLRRCCQRRATVERLNRWERLVRKLERVRRLQRLWHNLGVHLSQLDLSKRFRQRLAREYPKED